MELPPRLLCHFPHPLTQPSLPPAGTLMFASPLLFDRVGWRGVANATPNFMLWAGLPFFAGCIAFTFAAGGLPAVASRGVLMALVITGAILQVWGRRGRRLWHSNGATGGVAGKAGLELVSRRGSLSALHTHAASCATRMLAERSPFTSSFFAAPLFARSSPAAPSSRCSSPQRRWFTSGWTTRAAPRARVRRLGLGVWGWVPGSGAPGLSVLERELGMLPGAARSGPHQGLGEALAAGDHLTPVGTLWWARLLATAPGPAASVLLPLQKYRAIIPHQPALLPRSRHRRGGRPVRQIHRLDAAAGAAHSEVHKEEGSWCTAGWPHTHGACLCVAAGARSSQCCCCSPWAHHWW